MQKRFTPLKPVVIRPEDCTPDLKRRIVAGLPFFAGLGADAIDSVMPYFRETGADAGSRIICEADVSAGAADSDDIEQRAAGSAALENERRAGSEDKPALYVVAAGLVKLSRVDYEGRTVVLDFLVTGETFGPLAGAAPGDTASAHTDGCVFAVTTADMNRLFAAYPSAATRLLEQTAARVAALHERLHLLSVGSVRDRIVAALRSLSEKAGEPRGEDMLLQIPLTREDLASMAGTTPESASREISRLDREGYIAAGRRWISLRPDFFALD